MTSNQLPTELLTSLLYSTSIPTSSIPTSPSGYLFLPYHIDRFLVTATAFGWRECVGKLKNKEEALKWLEEELEKARKDWGDDTESAKVRITLSESLQLFITFTSIPLPSLSFLHPNYIPPSPSPPIPSESSFIPIILDTLPTSPSPYTKYKTTSRSHYILSRSRAGLGANYSSPAEVLLYNEQGKIMEGSIYNVAFWREGKWITPNEESGGLKGVMRRWLIENGIWEKGVTGKEEVEIGEMVLLSNAVRGVVVGRLVKSSLLET